MASVRRRGAAKREELCGVKDAKHVDLYDRVNLVPFDKLSTFFRGHLKSGSRSNRTAAN